MLSGKLVLIGILAAGFGRADIFFNGPADPTQSLLICGPTAAGCSESSWATSFAIAGPAIITRIAVAVDWVSGTQSIVVGLYQDNGGLPGTDLESQVVALPSNYGGLVAGTFSQSIAPGGYWVVVEPGGSDTLADWYQNPNISAPEEAVSYNGGGMWINEAGDNPGVAAVGGSPVLTPEPSAFPLLASAAALVAMIRRRAGSSGGA